MKRPTCATAQARTTRAPPEAPGAKAPRYSFAFASTAATYAVGRVVGEDRTAIVGRRSVRAKQASRSGDRVGRIPHVREAVAVSVARVALDRSYSSAARCAERSSEECRRATSSRGTASGPSRRLAFTVPGGLQPGASSAAVVALDLADRRENGPVNAVSSGGLLVEDEVVARNVGDGDGRGSERPRTRRPARDPADDDDDKEEQCCRCDQAGHVLQRGRRRDSRGEPSRSSCRSRLYQRFNGNTADSLLPRPAWRANGQADGWSDDHGQAGRPYTATYTLRPIRQIAAVRKLLAHQPSAKARPRGSPWASSNPSGCGPRPLARLASADFSCSRPAAVTLFAVCFGATLAGVPVETSSLISASSSFRCRSSSGGPTRELRKGLRVTVLLCAWAATLWLAGAPCLFRFLRRRRK